MTRHITRTPWYHFVTSHMAKKAEVLQKINVGELENTSHIVRQDNSVKNSNI